MTNDVFRFEVSEAAPFSFLPFFSARAQSAAKPRKAATITLLISACIGFARLLPQPAFATQRTALISAARMTSISADDNPILPTVLDGEQLDDPRKWLEEVDGEKQLDWAKACNAETTGELGDPAQTPLFGKLAKILDSKEKIPYVGRVLNDLYYNFWQDEEHVRGIWRRCTLEEYRKPEPAWDTVLDIDALNKEEGASWVWAGSTVLDEGPDAVRELVMIKLSPGGSDAKVAREFSLSKKSFVPESEGGFVLPQAKSSFNYKDRDTLIVSTDYGEGSMTDSGYPRTVRYWRRGTPLSEATLEYEGEAADVSVGGYAYLDRGIKYEWRYRALTFYTTIEQVRSPHAALWLRARLGRVGLSCPPLPPRRSRCPQLSPLPPRRSRCPTAPSRPCPCPRMRRRERLLTSCS